jgi:predicted DNA-binding transcriptional regulator AlpA
VAQIRILSPAKGEEKVAFSVRHMKRMAAEGKFPRPVRLTEGGENQHGRIGWVESELDAWLAARLAERDAGT